MTSLNIDEIRKLANNPLRVDMANVWCVMLQESLQWCLFEIDRLRQNQKTDFSIERCGKCGLTWDGEWNADKCHFPEAAQAKFCPVEKMKRQEEI